MKLIDSVWTLATATEEEAFEYALVKRFPPNGRPICPRCATSSTYTFNTRPLWKCCACGHQFSLTSGTRLSSLKIPLRQILIGAVLFSSARQGLASTELARQIGVQQKTAYLLLSKLRASTARPGLTLTGVVQIDGCTIGGYRLAENHAKHTFGRRYYQKFDNRMVVVVAREPEGRTIAAPFSKESEAKMWLSARLENTAVIHADGGRAWRGLRQLFAMLTVDHSKSFADGDVNTNWAESFFSMLRKMQSGVHHKITRDRMQEYLDELTWKQDNRARPIPDQTEDLISGLLMPEAA